MIQSQVRLDFLRRSTMAFVASFYQDRPNLVFEKLRRLGIERPRSGCKKHPNKNRHQPLRGHSFRFYKSENQLNRGQCLVWTQSVETASFGLENDEVVRAWWEIGFSPTRTQIASRNGGNVDKAPVSSAHGSYVAAAVATAVATAAKRWEVFRESVWFTEVVCARRVYLSNRSASVQGNRSTVWRR